MRKAKQVALAVLVLGLLFGLHAWAGASTSAEHEPAEATAHGGGHAGACQDHWNLAQALIPSLRTELCGSLGQTLMGDTVNRGMHVVMGLIVFVLSILMGLAARRAMSRTDEEVVVPRRFGAFAFFDLIVEALLAVMEPQMGTKKARFFLPLIASLATFILISNLLGSIPGLLPPTDNLNTTLALGLVVFVVTHIYGVREHGIAYFKHFLGPIIKWYALPLMLLMLVIEIISHIVRPLSLGIRLMGNMFGDHAVLGIFLAFGIPLIPMPIQILGLVVAIVQTVVFCLLSIVYIALAVEHAEEH